MPNREVHSTSSEKRIEMRRKISPSRSTQLGETSSGGWEGGSSTKEMEHKLKRREEDIVQKLTKMSFEELDKFRDQDKNNPYREALFTKALKSKISQELSSIDSKKQEYRAALQKLNPAELQALLDKQTASADPRMQQFIDIVKAEQQQRNDAESSQKN